MTTSIFGKVTHAPQRLLVATVRGYRFAISPWLGSSCRFEPSCSAFAIEALQRHGACAGTLLTAGRVLRCHPWCEGGRDTVPEPGRGLFSGLFTRGGVGRTTGVGVSCPIDSPRPLSLHSLHPAEKNLP